MIVAQAPANVQFDSPTEDFGLLAAKSGQTRFLIVPERRYFMIEGQGAPESPSFRAAFASASASRSSWDDDAGSSSPLVQAGDWGRQA